MDVLHDQEQLAVLGDHVDGLHHVRMPDARHDARLVQEHRDELGVPGVPLVQSLDGDDPREARGADLPCEVHGGHAAGRDLAAERIAPSDRAASQFGHPALLDRTTRQGARRFQLWCKHAPVLEVAHLGLPVENLCSERRKPMAILGHGWVAKLRHSAAPPLIEVRLGPRATGLRRGNY